MNVSISNGCNVFLWYIIQVERKLSAIFFIFFSLNLLLSSFLCEWMRGEVIVSLFSRSYTIQWEDHRVPMFIVNIYYYTAIMNNYYIKYSGLQNGTFRKCPSFSTTNGNELFQLYSSYEKPIKYFMIRSRMSTKRAKSKDTVVWEDFDW